MLLLLYLDWTALKHSKSLGSFHLGQCWPTDKKKNSFPNGLARVKVLSISVDALDHPTVLLVLSLDSRDGSDHAIIHITYNVCALFSITRRAVDQIVCETTLGYAIVVFLVPFSFMFSACITSIPHAIGHSTSTPNASPVPYIQYIHGSIFSRTNTGRSSAYIYTYKRAVGIYNSLSYRPNVFLRMDGGKTVAYSIYCNAYFGLLQAAGTFTSQLHTRPMFMTGRKYIHTIQHCYPVYVL